MLKTRLTEALKIRHPIIQAPMAFAAGGKLASAVGNAGGLGLIGGGYGDVEWIQTQFREAGNQAIGCGLITWALKNNLAALECVLAHEPKAIFLSFGNPREYINLIRSHQRNSDEQIIICQVQSVRDAQQALDCGADIIVAQGAEAGGHGEHRATMTLVPEIADSIAKENSSALLCAAGGIADGRTLAAALMLGADGALVGSRFWASEEALVHTNMLDRAIDATGDDTIRSSVMDIARKLKWPDRYTARVLKNSFTEQWHNDIEGLIHNSEAQAARWKEAWQAGNTDIANTFVGEVAGLINSVDPAATILESMVSEAQAAIHKAKAMIHA